MKFVPSARLEVSSLKFKAKENDKDDEYVFEVDKENPIDFNRPFRIFLTDRYRVFEMYDSKNENKLYAPWPKQMQSSDGIQKGSSSTSRKQKSAKQAILPLTGPNGDIAPFDYFQVIIHQDTGNPEIDDSHLVDATPFNLKVKPASPSDAVVTYLVGPRDLYDRYYPLSIHGTFGLLKLDWIAYSQSRLVTVGVKWLMEGIEGENHATKSSSYICGKLSLHSKQPFNKKSVLLKTPEHKAIKVAHGESIPLLRSAVAVPDDTKFTFEAYLHDPVNKSAVIKTSLIFEDHHFSEQNGFTKSEVIVGSGHAKIEVKITMKPNDVNYLRHGTTPM